MGFQTMYPAKNNSPQTTLAEDITSSATSMTLTDASVLPAAPNICVLGIDDTAEIISYTAIAGNVVSGIVRGINDTTPKAWAAETIVARNFTAYDHEAFLYNLNDLDERKQEVLDFDDEPTEDSSNPVTSDGIFNALSTKEDILTFDSTPTASSSNPVTSDGIKAYVDSHDDFKITGSVSSSSYTLTDARINSEHWEVDWVRFGTPAYVTTAVNWSTNITNHTVTLTATYTGSTNVTINMHWIQ